MNTLSRWNIKEYQFYSQSYDKVISWLPLLLIDVSQALLGSQEGALAYMSQQYSLPACPIFFASILPQWTGLHVKVGPCTFFEINQLTWYVIHVPHFTFRGITFGQVHISWPHFKKILIRWRKRYMPQQNSNKYLCLQPWNFTLFL